MKFFKLIKQSLISIFANKARSFLTTLGIIIGIGSVIGLVALGNGVQQEIKGEISSLGSSRLNVVSGSGFSRASNFASGQSNAPRQFGQTQSLTKDDLTSLESLTFDKEFVSEVAGSLTTNANIKYNDKELLSTVVGVSPKYFLISNLNIISGSVYNTRESYSAILGSKVAKELFLEEDPLNQTVNIRGTEFNVVGVLEEEPESNFSANTPNYSVFIPDYVALDLIETKYYNSFILTAVSEDKIEQAKTQITDILLKNHEIESSESADFSIITPQDLLSVAGQITGVLTALLSGIAAISLLVGGIGIMNIMLVSVTERTREIGLRKAVGAKTFDILVQFLTEALLLTVIGGVFGIVIGFLISSLASQALGFEGVITIDSILLAVGVSSFIGIVFGLYPALKAARLNPIDALRYE